MKQGSFTQQVKNEICAYGYEEKNYLPLLSGFVKTNGAIGISNHGLSLNLQTENSQIARLIYKAFNTVFGITPSFSYSRKMKLDKGTVYHLSVSDNVTDILEKLEIMVDGETTLPKTVLDKDGVRYFIAGTFLASGSVNSPSSHNYHLQMIVQEESLAKMLIKQLNKFKNERNMDFKYIARKNKYVIYLKKADQITTFLSLVNATSSMLDFENIRIEKDFINSENRYQICFNANYEKSIAKANEQLEDIRILEETHYTFKLTQKEKYVMEARKENPDAPLSQLVSYLEGKYPDITVSKSGSSRIFNKIHDTALFAKRKG
jgi:DNA-binding protein WhiA